MIDPLITVIIDTFNYGRFIGEAIDSVLAQDYPMERVQVVVIDDGSTDDTAQRLVRYEARVGYYRKPNGGQASALNLGFEKGRGEIVALLDADDYWFPGKLRRLREEFARDCEIGFVSHPLSEIDTGTGAARDTPCGFVSGYLPSDLSGLLNYRVSPTSALAFRRAVLERILPIPDQFRLQADLYLALLAVFIGKTVVIPESLGVHRLHGDNLYSRTGAAQTTEQAKRDLAMRRQIIQVTRQWLEGHEFNTSTREIDMFYRQLMIFLSTDEFEIEPPGRIRFFKHLLECNRVYGSLGNSKLRTINYAKAFVSLATGKGKRQ
jgi:glycosyltransferase involved in cell wall biosynthesis